MIRIEIHDFQSIDSVVLEVNGFAALVGRSNIGKSAVIRAVRAVLTNAQGTAFVRHGPTCARRLKGVKSCKCKSSVRLVGVDFDILWEKGDADNRYVVNGKTYEAVPRGFPDFLSPWFQPIKIGDKSMLLQVASQWDPLFLLEASGPAVADVLSDVAQLDRINVASRLVEKDRREVLATIKVRDKDIQKYRDALSHYAGLDGTVEQMESLTSDAEPLLGRQKALKAIRRYEEAMRTIEATISHLEPVETLVFPAQEPLLRAKKTWDFVTTKQREHDTRQTLVQRLSPVETLDMPDGKHLDRTVKAAEGMLDWLDQLRAIKAVYMKLTPVEKLTVPSLDGVERSVQASQAVLDFAAKYQHLEEMVASLGDEWDEVRKAEDLIHEELRAFKTCPLCEQPFGGDP